MDPLNPFSPFHPLNPLNPLVLTGSTPAELTPDERAANVQAVGEAIRAVLDAAGGYLLALLITLSAIGAVMDLFR